VFTQEHVDRLSKGEEAGAGHAELIWNSVDADATTVDVRLNRNGLGSIEVIGAYQSKADARCNYNMTIWAKSWSEIIEECTGR
jgi:hypothetical protein